nr:M48 family metallopeptidase [Schlegelella koreensis]
MVLGIVLWLLLIAGTVGLALVYLLFAFLFYLFAQSALIAYIRGNGVLLSPQQFPALHAQFDACCRSLGISEQPAPYLLQGNGILNAFATRFLGRDYIVLLSDIVDAMEAHPDGVRFYVGHELGHVRMRHLTGWFLRAPALWLPLLGAAYARAKESTCDRHGAACCETRGNAARAMAALAAGPRLWADLDLAAFRAQTAATSGFWMSYHELVGGYPWLCKRVVRVLDPEAPLPRRHGLAYLFALFVPYLGRAGGAGGVIVVALVIGIVAAVGIPAYLDHTTRTELTRAYESSASARVALGDYFVRNGAPPESLDDAGVAGRLPDGSRLTLDPSDMIVTVTTPRGATLLLVPKDEDGAVTWTCEVGDDVRAGATPAACRPKE